MGNVRRFLKSRECPVSIYFVLLLFLNMWAADKEVVKVIGPITVLLFLIFLTIVAWIGEQRKKLKEMDDKLSKIAEDFAACREKLENSLIITKL